MASVWLRGNEGCRNATSAVHQAVAGRRGPVLRCATRIWRGLPYNFAQKISCFHNDLAGKCGQGLGMCHICQTRLSPICCKKSRVRDTHIQSGEGHKNGINSTTSGHPRASHRSATNDSRPRLRGRPTLQAVAGRPRRAIFALAAGAPAAFSKRPVFELIEYENGWFMPVVHHSRLSERGIQTSRNTSNLSSIEQTLGNRLDRIVSA